MRLSQDEEMLLKNAAAAEKMPMSELARRRIFSELLAGEIAAMRAENNAINEALTASVVELTQQLRFAQGLCVHILKSLNPEGYRSDIKQIREHIFGSEEV